MLAAIPALPVRELARSLGFYRDLVGFEVAHEDRGFAVLRRDAAELHLWVASDAAWRDRLRAILDGTLAVDPATVRMSVSGAEDFIAGTASCRVQVDDVDARYDKLEPLGIVHPNGALEGKPWGTREFAVLDPDCNLLTFFERL